MKDYGKGILYIYSSHQYTPTQTDLLEIRGYYIKLLNRLYKLIKKADPSIDNLISQGICFLTDIQYAFDGNFTVEEYANSYIDWNEWLDTTIDYMNLMYADRKERDR